MKGIPPKHIALAAHVLAEHKARIKSGKPPEGAKYIRIDTGGYLYYFTPAEMADLLKVATKTLERWRNRGEGPPWKKTGSKQIRYDACGFEDWYGNLPGHEVPP